MLRFFIDRPIFAAVISIIITLAGAATLSTLPVEQYPDVTPPQISVEASYPAPVRKSSRSRWPHRWSRRSTASTT